MIGLARSRLLWKINRWSSLPNVYWPLVSSTSMQESIKLRYSKLDPYVQVSLLSHNRTRPLRVSRTIFYDAHTAAAKIMTYQFKHQRDFGKLFSVRGRLYLHCALYRKIYLSANLFSIGEYPKWNPLKKQNWARK